MSHLKRIQNRLLDAAREGQLDEIQKAINSHGLLRCGDFNLLCCAIKFDKPQVVKFLLSQGCRVSSQETRAESPLHLAVQKGNVPIIKSLLNKGAPIDAQDKSGCTALHVAIRNSQISIVKTLLSHSASIDIRDDNDLSPFHYAVTKNVEVVSTLLKYGASIDEKCNGNNTPLHLAAQSADLEIVKFLVGKKAPIDALNDKNESPVHLSFENDDSNVTVFLIESNASVIHSNSSEESVLHLAVKKDYYHVVKILLDTNVDVNIVTLSNVTPIHVAVANENQTICALLLKFDANVNVADQDGKTPLLIAVEQDNYEISKMLLEKNADVNLNVKGNVTPLFVAARSGNEKLFTLLLQSNPEKWSDDLQEETELILKHAVNKGILSIVEFILKNFKVIHRNFNNLLKSMLLGSLENFNKILNLFLNNGFHFGKEVVHDPEFVSAVIKAGYIRIFEDLLLHGLDVNMMINVYGYISTRRYSLLNFAFNQEQKHIAELLVQNGAKIDNIVDDSRSSPLFSIIYKYNSLSSDKDFLELCLSKGANVNEKDFAGRTPLHQIISTQSVQLDTVKLFIKHGAQVNCEDNEGWTPLHLAQREDIAEYLLTKGASVNHINKDGDTALHAAVARSDLKTVQLLIRYHANTNMQNNNGYSPLHLAKTVNIAAILLKNRASVEVKNNMGETPLHKVVSGRSDSSLQLVELFIQHKADINSQDISGRTPLFLAWSEDVAKILLENGAQVNMKNNWGRTPFFSAVSGSVSKVNLFLKYNANTHYQDKNGKTPLHLKVRDDVAELLIKEGVSLDSKTDKDFTPLLKAVKRGNLKIAELLLLYDADLNIVKGDGETAIHFAFMQNKGKMFKQLLESNLNVVITEKHMQKLMEYMEKKLSVNNPKKRMIEMLQQHIVKLKTVGLFVNETFLKVPLDKMLDKFKEQCEMEVKQMKSDKIGESSISVFDVLTGNSARLVAGLENNSFEKAIDEGTWVKTYPIYNSLLSFKLNRTKKRRDLLCETQAALDIFNLPELCVEKIYSYLNNKDLIIFALALKKQKSN